MILIFGKDRHKAKLTKLRAKLHSMDAVISTGNKVPFWYVQDRDQLRAKVAELEFILESVNAN